MRTPGGRTAGWGTESRPGRLGLVFITVWTAFLFEPLRSGWERRDEVAGLVGMAATVAFAVWYVLTARRLRMALRLPDPPRVRIGPEASIAVAVALAMVMCLALGQVGTTASVYLCVLCVMLDRRWAETAVVAVIVVTYGAGWVVPGWEHDNTLLLSLLAASVAVWGIQQMMLGNAALRAATAENQRLAVAEERHRFARDLHDILGHSLTVITVKAELAGKLVDRDLGRAKKELADLERLSRDALVDVRRAVEGYRELTLPGELARARAALGAAQIDADLPNATDEVPGELRELFAWTVREGVTNVIRHSGARLCAVRLSATCAEVADDGRGPTDPGLAQAGLRGLRERAAAHDATVITEVRRPQGFSLQVRVR